MSIPALSTTTTSTALDNKQTRFAVASTTGITGAGSLTTPASILVIGGEAMLVQNVPVSGTVEVFRGFNGTQARAHSSGATVYFGAKTRFDSNRVGRVGLAGDSGVLPDFRLPLGGLVTDPDTGYEYRLVDCQAALANGVWVSIDGSGLATALATGSVGRIGIIVETIGASDTYAWALVAGTYNAALFSTTVTTACVLLANTNAPTISTTTGGNVVFNARCIALSTSSGATTNVGTAYINHPWCYGITTDIIP
jgi:hypothetical protein